MAFVAATTTTGFLGKAHGVRRELRSSRILVAPVRRSMVTTMAAGAPVVREGVARVATLVYAVIMGAGGVSAFLKTKSKPSLISGLASGASLALLAPHGSTPSLVSSQLM